MIRALLLACLGAGSFAAVYLLMPPRTETNESGAPVPQQGTAPILDPAPLMTGSLPDDSASIGFELRPGAEPVRSEGETRHAAIRDVTPNTVVATTLAAGAQAPADPATARTERLFNPIVVDAGTIKARDREIHLAGIDAPEFDKMCGTGAAAWPCGHLARAALRSFIHSRAIECQIPASSDKIPDPAECLVGGDDMSDWLVANGWAKRSGDAYADAESAAKKAKLGIWSDKRPDAQPTTVAGGG